MSQEMNRRRNKQFIWTLLTALVSAVAVSVSTIIYVGVTQEKNNERIRQQQIENNRQWCELMIPLDNAYSSVPPTTELGRKVATAIHKLRHDFEC